MGGPCPGRARVIREATGQAPEQVWTVQHRMGGQSVDKGERAGTRQELRCSESWSQNFLHVLRSAYSHPRVPYNVQNAVSV